MAILAARAAAAPSGTAYLLYPEARTTAVHRTALQQPGRRSEITNRFCGRLARGLVNRLMRDLCAMSMLPFAFPWASRSLAPRGPRPMHEALTISARYGAARRPTHFKVALPRLLPVCLQEPCNWSKSAIGHLLPRTRAPSQWDVTARRT